MTNSRSLKGLNTKIISTGLAIATGIGVVGLIGVRTAQEAEANSTPADDVAEISSDATGASNTRSSAGYSVAQLDAYAASLAQEALRLQEYRNQLNDLVNQLNSNSNSIPKATGNESGAVRPANQPASKPNVKPQSKPAPAIAQPKPQAQSEGS